jgi:hypothetical protein
MRRTALCASVAAVLLAAGCSSSDRDGGPSPGRSGGPASAAGPGPCTAGAGGVGCGPVPGPPTTLQQLTERLLTVAEVDPGRYSRTQKIKRSDTLPGCDYRAVKLPGRQVAQANYFKYWRDYPRWKERFSRSKYYRTMAKDAYRQAAVLYSDPAQQDADYRNLWDRKRCKGAKRVYDESAGDVSGWKYSRRTQPGYCPRGGMCVLVADYLRKGNITLVSVVLEAGKKGDPDRKAAIARADRFRDALIRKMDGR